MSNIEIKKEIARKIMKELNVVPAYIDAFVNDGTITWYAGPIGAGYYLSKETENPSGEELLATVEKLAQAGDLVYAILVGDYIIGGERVTMKTFLLVDDDMVDNYEVNTSADPLDGILVEYNHGTFYTCGYVEGFYGEYGDVFIQGRNGGIARVH